MDPFMPQMEEGIMHAWGVENLFNDARAERRLGGV